MLEYVCRQDTFPGYGVGLFISSYSTSKCLKKETSGVKFTLKLSVLIFQVDGGKVEKLIK